MSRLRDGRRFSWRYAFGELILITLGIYLAFAVNNWSETRKERKLEQFYLTKLLADVDRSVSLLEWHIELAESHKAGAAVLDGLLAQGRRVDQDSLKRYLNAFNVNPRFQIADFSYQSLLQSGDYRIIRSDSLRNALDHFYLELMPGVVTTENWFRERLDDKFYPIKESVYLVRSQTFQDINRLFDPIFRDNIYVLPAYIQQEEQQLIATLKAAELLRQLIQESRE